MLLYHSNNIILFYSNDLITAIETDIKIVLINNYCMLCYQVFIQL